jgi:hypothetical protein
MRRALGPILMASIQLGGWQTGDAAMLQAAVSSDIQN